MKYFQLILLLVCTLGLYAQITVDSCIANWKGVSYELEPVFENMLNAIPSDTFYIAPNDVQASDNFDGQSPVFVSGTHGPWKSFNGVGNLILSGDSIKAGDMIMLREGIYDIPTTLDFPFVGTEDNPVKIKNYPNEMPELRGTFDSAWHYSVTHPIDSNALTSYYTSWEKIPMIRLSGKYLVIDGLRFTKPHLNSILYKSDYIIMQHCFLEGTLEDIIKTTEETDYGLMQYNTFTNFAGEAIDVFGARNFYVINNNFHNAYEDVNLKSNITGAWAKGGADNIYFINNSFYDLKVFNNALVLGGCCWNWTTNPLDNQGNVKPVSTNVFAYGNTFSNISTDPNSTYNFKGVLSFQASQFTGASDNIFHNCDDVMSVTSTSQGNISLKAKDLFFKNNVISNQNGGRLYNLLDNEDSTTIVIDSNCVYADAATSCIVGVGNEFTYANFKAKYAYDQNGCEGDYVSTCNAITTYLPDNRNDLFEIKVYPNPTQTYLTIEVKNADNIFREVELFDITGKLVLSRSFTGSNLQVYLDNLTHGMYFLTLSDNYGINFTQKIIVNEL